MFVNVSYCNYKFNITGRSNRKHDNRPNVEILSFGKNEETTNVSHSEPLQKKTLPKK